MAKLFANSGDPDQTPRFAASDLGLHCLPVTLIVVSRLQWVKSILNCYRSDGNPVGPVTVRYIFKENARWVFSVHVTTVNSYIKHLLPGFSGFRLPLMNDRLDISKYS